MSYFYALNGFYDNLIPATRRLRIDWRFVATLVGIVMLGTAAGVGAPRVVEAYRSYQAANVEAGAASAAYVSAELPREWRWEPKAVKYEHMFMNHR